MRLHDFRVLTFDCYGTLIDWESGIHAALQPLLRKSGQAMTRDAALEAFAQHCTAQQAEAPALPCSALLAAVHARLADEWGIEPDEQADARFGASVPDWPAFPDSAEALRYLKQHYKLVALSNMDHAGLAGSQRRLGIAFDAAYTPEEIGSYKPSPRNFAYMLDKLNALGHGRGEVLHTARSLFLDHAPAKRLGLASAWIDRRGSQEAGDGVVPPFSGAGYEFRFTSIGEMARAHQAEAVA